jgi:WD40 repeat protein
MESATKAEQAETDSPRFTQRKRPLRRRLSHTLEASITVLMVVSLLLGWFAVTKWRSAQGNGPALFTYVSQPGQVEYDSHWTPDGEHLVFVIYTIATNQYRYLVWDAATGKARQTLAIKLPSSVVGKGMLDSLDGHYALIRTNGATPQVWVLKLANILTGQVKLIYQGTYQGQNASDLPPAIFSGKSKYAAFVGANERIYIWDIAAGKVLQITDPLTLSSKARVEQFAWSADDKRLMAESSPAGFVKPERLQVWSAQSGHTLLNFVETPAISLIPPLLGPGGGFAGLSPDGTRVLTYNQQTGVFTERASNTLKVLQTFSVKLGLPDSGGYGVFWEANGTRILWQNYQSVYVWNASTGRLVLTLSSKNASSALLVPSGGRYMTGVQSGNLLEIWDMVTGTKVRTIALAIKPLSVIWSPDGKYLDLNDGNQKGQFFNALTGKPITHYQGNGALLSPDGQSIAILTNLPVSQTSNDLRHAMVQILSVR